MSQTIIVVAQARFCYQMRHGHCPGDSGDVKCFFCPGCVIGLEERIHILKMFDEEILKGAKA